MLSRSRAPGCVVGPISYNGIQLLIITTHFVALSQFTGYVVGICALFLTGVESGDQVLLNSEVLYSVFVLSSGVIINEHKIFLCYIPIFGENFTTDTQASHLMQKLSDVKDISNGKLLLTPGVRIYKNIIKGRNLSPYRQALFDCTIHQGNSTHNISFLEFIAMVDTPSRCMIKVFRGAGVVIPSKPPPPTNNFCLYPPPVLRWFWKDPLMTPTTPLQASFTATPPHPPPLPPNKSFDHTPVATIKVWCSCGGKDRKQTAYKHDFKAVHV